MSGFEEPIIGLIHVRGLKKQPNAGLATLWRVRFIRLGI